MSRERRFLVESLAPPVELEGDEAHHLLRVLRLGEGDEVVLFDGRGRAARAVVTTVAPGRVGLEPRAEAPTGESPLPLTVGVAMPKADKMSLVVQKLTELGAVRIVPLVTERGEASAERTRRSLPRFRRIAVEACKQCGRSRLPEIDAPEALEELLVDVEASRASAVLAAHPGAPPLEPPEGAGPLLVLVGPEGGWSEAELELLERGGARLFGLGPRTLRTETAAIAATALIQWTAGDLRMLAAP